MGNWTLKKILGGFVVLVVVYEWIVSMCCCSAPEQAPAVVAKAAETAGGQMTSLWICLLILELVIYTAIGVALYGKKN